MLVCLGDNIWNYSEIYIPVHFPGNEEERRVKGRKRRVGFERVCLAVNGPTGKRKRGRPPLTFVTGALLRIYYSASTEEGRGPCVTHVHFNAITASSVRGSKWPRRKIPPPRFRVVASDGKKKNPPTFSLPPQGSR